MQLAVALAVSALVAVAALALVAGGDESTPGDGGNAAAAAEPEPETVSSCRRGTVYGDLKPGWRKRAVVAGPLALLLTPDRSPKHFSPDGPVKVLALVDAGASVTLAVPEAERQRLSLLYGVAGPGARSWRLSDGTSSVRFTGCPSDTEYPGRQSQFNGGFFVRDAHCAAIDVWIEGRADPIRRWLPLGVADRACPP
jgi:hypothetical protein